MKFVWFAFLMFSSLVFGQEFHQEIINNKPDLSPLIINNSSSTFIQSSSYKLNAKVPQSKNKNLPHTFHTPKKALTLSKYKQHNKTKISTISKKRIGKKNDD